MKIFKRFFKEAAPTNHTGASIANFDPMLFPPGEDDLSQDYQTPGESGQAKWRFSNIWPVMKLTMKGIDSMVDASQEYTKLQDESRQNVLRKNFNQFIEESAIKVTGLNGTVPKCKEGMEYDKKLNACVPIKTQWSGYHGAGSFNVRIKQGNTNGNGNGNGSDNGNGNGHAGGNGNGSGNGNGGGGNGG
jgi:hypothetical protein